jgi:hypothetical protein
MTPSASTLALAHPCDVRHRVGFAGKITVGPMATVWSSLIFVAVALGFVAGQVRNLHWFLIPLTLCGCLMGTDMVKWMSSRLDLYDATGLIALLGYHFFFIAPLLMVTWEYRMKYLPDQPEDYRDWLGAMAIINLAGLLLYKYAVKHLPAVRTRKVNLSAPPWQIAASRFWVLWGLFLILSCGAQGGFLLLLAGYAGISRPTANGSQGMT